MNKKAFNLYGLGHHFNSTNTCIYVLTPVTTILTRETLYRIYIKGMEQECSYQEFYSYSINYNMRTTTNIKIDTMIDLSNNKYIVYIRDSSLDSLLNPVFNIYHTRQDKIEKILNNVI